MVNLAELLREHGGEAAVVPFAAMNGHAVSVLTVLERTAVVVEEGEERRLVRIDSLTVDPTDLIWKSLKGTAKRQHWLSSQRGLAASRRSHLRNEGKGECPRCPEGQRVHPLSELNSNRYCTPCNRQYQRDMRAKQRAAKSG